MTTNPLASSEGKNSGNRLGLNPSERLQALSEVLPTVDSSTRSLLGGLSAGIGEGSPTGTKRAGGTPDDQKETHSPETEIRDINFSIQIPYEKVEERKIEKPTLSQIFNAVKQKKWGEVITLAFSMFFGKGQEEQGLGFFVHGLENIGSKEKADIVEQIESINQSSLSWQEKMKASLLKAESEYSLYKDGYKRERTANCDPAKTKQVREGEKLSDLVSFEIWTEIRTGGVLGALFFDKALPKGAYVYFDALGYPLALSLQSGDKIKVPMYRKAPKEEQEKMKNATRFDFLEDQIKEGDIIFASQEGSDMKSKAVGFLTKMFQATSDENESFPFIHVMVCTGKTQDGQVLISHQLIQGGKVEQGAGREDNLRDLVSKEKLPKGTDPDAGREIRKYNAFSIGRIPDPTQIPRFLSEVVRVRNEIQNYSQEKALSSVVPRVLSRIGNPTLEMAGKIIGNKSSGNDEKTICVDLVTRAAQNSGIREIQKGMLAPEIFQAIDIVTSMNI